MSPAQTLDHLLDLCCTEIERRATLAKANGQVEPGVLRSGAAAFRSALDNADEADEAAVSPLAPASAARVPVTVHLSDIAPSQPAVEAIVLATQAAASEIPWIPTPRMNDQGVSVALGPVNEVRDLGDLTCGFMLLAPGATYPDHAHPPQEIYLPIAGDGRWRHGGNPDHRALPTDGLVYNPPRGLHGTIAGAEPLLAFYILWP